MLKDKVMLITGASRGIGRATALLAAENHARVIVNYNNSEGAASELIDSIVSKGYNATMIKADVSKEEEVKKMFKQIKTDFGHLDVLVNNAGIMKGSLLLMTKTEDANDMIDINCKGTYFCLQQAAKMMMRQMKGKIINVSSIMGVQGCIGYVAYSSTKSFVIGLTKSSAKELGKYGITVNAVAPGFIDTDLTAGFKPEIRDQVISSIPLGKMGSPEDVAKVVVMLSSSYSDYINGQIIGVDGGQVM